MFDEYKKYIAVYDKFHGGEQYLFKFENGYGASVIKIEIIPGVKSDTWELAVIRWCSEPFDFLWTLCYDTPITDDVIGFLSDKDVCKYLEDIKRLKEKTE